MLPDPGSEIRDLGWIKNQDPGFGLKHPGSATLHSNMTVLVSQSDWFGGWEGGEG
jgi:hypothetical protein